MPRVARIPASRCNGSEVKVRAPATYTARIRPPNPPSATWSHDPPPAQPHSRGGRSHSIPLSDHAHADCLVLGFRGVHRSGRNPRDPPPFPRNPFCVLVGKTWIALLSPTGLPVAVWMNLLAAASSAAASRGDAMNAKTGGDGDR